MQQLWGGVTRDTPPPHVPPPSHHQIPRRRQSQLNIFLVEAAGMMKEAHAWTKPGWKRSWTMRPRTPCKGRESWGLWGGHAQGCGVRWSGAGTATPGSLARCLESNVLCVAHTRIRTCIHIYTHSFIDGWYPSISHHFFIHKIRIEPLLGTSYHSLHFIENQDWATLSGSPCLPQLMAGRARVPPGSLTPPVFLPLCPPASCEGGQ